MPARGQLTPSHPTYVILEIRPPGTSLVAEDHVHVVAALPMHSNDNSKSTLHAPFQVSSSRRDGDSSIEHAHNQLPHPVQPSFAKRLPPPSFSAGHCDYFAWECCHLEPKGTVDELPDQAWLLATRLGGKFMKPESQLRVYGVELRWMHAPIHTSWKAPFDAPMLVGYLLVDSQYCEVHASCLSSYGWCFCQQPRQCIPHLRQGLAKDHYKMS